MSLRLKRTQKLQVVFFGKKKDNLILLLGSYFRFGSLILQYKYFPEHYFIKFKKGPNITLIPSVQWSGKTSRTSGTEPHNSRNTNIQFCGYKIIFPWLEPNNNHGSTVRPRDTRPQAARTSQVHVFELGPKIFEMHVFAHFCTFFW